jgi:hypothetical protein
VPLEEEEKEEGEKKKAVIHSSCEVIRPLLPVFLNITSQ